MDNYSLKEDEVVLYKGDVTLSEKDSAKLILTNLNIVFVTKIKELLNKAETKVDAYPIEEIKMYEGIPQVKTSGKLVEIYLKTTEKECVFDSKIELTKFVNAVKKLLTGKTMTDRCILKVKEKIDFVDETFDVDIVGATGSAIKNGVGGAIENGINSATNAIGKGITNIFKKKNKE